jgi:glutamyl-tRNA reductase
MISNFKVVSLSHLRAPVSVRELVALNEYSCKRLMTTIKEFTNVSELLILSTCNRTEVYYIADKDYSKEIVSLIGVEKRITPIESYFSYFEIINDHQKAIQYLFDVSMGLSSQVIGDSQIITQVKQAYQWAADLSMAGPFLHRLLHTIFFTNKKVVQTTSFRDGAASVSYATVELAESLCTALSDPKVLIIGLGEMGTDVCKHISKTSFKHVTVSNRTISQAETLGACFGFNVVDFENIWEAIQDADIIIGALSKDEPIITKNGVQALSFLSCKYFIDISVPRSVEHAVEEIPGAIVYNIDDIHTKTTAVLEKRKQAIPIVKNIIEESILEFNDWSNEMIVSPVINKFKNALEDIRQREMERHLKHLDQDQFEKVEMITKSIMQKIVKLPVLQLKAACRRGDSETLSDVLKELFDLEKQPNEVNVK